MPVFFCRDQPSAWHVPLLSLIDTETTMPRKALLASVLSSSPCHLRCLAILTAAWGSHGFRATTLVRHLVSSSTTSDATSSSSCWRRELGGVGGDVYRRDPQRADVHFVGFSRRHRRRPLSTGGAQLGCDSSAEASARDAGDPAAAAATSVAGAANTTAAVEVEERKWLGNGPDPMANTGKILPGTSASLAAVANGGEKGHGVPTEEMWLNGPFKAPLPPGPLVSTMVSDGGGAKALSVGLSQRGEERVVIV